MPPGKTRDRMIPGPSWGQDTFIPASNVFPNSNNRIERVMESIEKANRGICRSGIPEALSHRPAGVFHIPSHSIVVSVSNATLKIQTWAEVPLHRYSASQWKPGGHEGVPVTPFSIRGSPSYYNMVRGSLTYSWITLKNLWILNQELNIMIFPGTSCECTNILYTICCYTICLDERYRKTRINQD